MMQIRCYSSDEQLLERLFTLYGTGDVLDMSGTKFTHKNDLRDTEVAVVDLKYNSLPTGTHFTSSVIVLASVPRFPEAFTLLQQGVRGYGNRQMRTSNLKQAIENVKEGQIWLPPSIISQLIGVVGKGDIPKQGKDPKPRDTLLGKLSKREEEVALLVAEGMSNQEVADKLYVSLRTVKAHLSSIYEKTAVRNRLELGLALS